MVSFIILWQLSLAIDPNSDAFLEEMMTTFKGQPSQDTQSQVCNPIPDAVQTEKTQEEADKAVP